MLINNGLAKENSSSSSHNFSSSQNLLKKNKMKFHFYFVIFLTRPLSSQSAPLFDEPTLDYIGENLGPYGECQGDCDSSRNCDVSKVGNCADF